MKDSNPMFPGYPNLPHYASWARIAKACSQECERLRGIIAKLSKPSSGREPPHCPNCSCGLESQPLEHVCPSCGRPPGDIEALDALRFRFLTEDIDDRGKREVRNRLLERMAVMSYSAAGRDIDLLIAATTVKTNDIRQAGKEGLEQIREHGPALIDSMIASKTECAAPANQKRVAHSEPLPVESGSGGGAIDAEAPRMGRAPDCPNAGCDGECYPIATGNGDCEPAQCEWCYRWRAAVPRTGEQK